MGESSLLSSFTEPGDPGRSMKGKLLGEQSKSRSQDFHNRGEWNRNLALTNKGLKFV
jgi:hypothetical protein